MLYGESFLDLRLPKKEGVVEFVEGATLVRRPSVNLRGPLGSFSPGTGLLKLDILFIIDIYFYGEFGDPPPKK